MVTVTCGTSLYDLTALHPADTFDGTRFTDPQMMHAMANLVADSTPIPIWRTSRGWSSTGYSLISLCPTSTASNSWSG
jgi:hypothetical protein